MENENKNTVTKKSKSTLIMFSIFLTIVLAGGIYLATLNYRKSFSISQNENAVVARVNNVDITRKSFNLAMSGVVKSIDSNKIDTTKNEVQEEIMLQALNSMINTEVIVQKAKQMQLSISQSEVDTEINKIIKDLGGYDNYVSTLKKIGITENDMRNDVEKQLLISLYEYKTIDSSKDVVTETEIKLFYETLQNKYIAEGSIAPDLDLIRDKITQKIIERKHQLLLEADAKKLRETAKIEVLI